MTVVLKIWPQSSQSQWWRISPVSMNSEACAATTYSPQAGQRGMVEENGLEHAAGANVV
jgi:hypothetical protein